VIKPMRVTNWVRTDPVEWMDEEDIVRRLLSLVSAQAELLDEMRIELVRARAERDILERVLQAEFLRRDSLTEPVAIRPVAVPAPPDPPAQDLIPIIQPPSAWPLVVEVPAEPTWITVAQAATKTGLERSNVYHWITEGRVRSKKIAPRCMVVAEEDCPPTRLRRGHGAKAKAKEIHTVEETSLHDEGRSVLRGAAPPGGSEETR
jgi:hypothetical protein